LTGLREPSAWDRQQGDKVDYYDLKGVLEALLGALQIPVTFSPGDDPSFHPGKCALIKSGEKVLGLCGELHPQVQENYEIVTPVMAADLDLDAMLALAAMHSFPVAPVSEYPPILEDLALVVDEDVPAEKVEALIRQTGGKLVVKVRLFDIFRGKQLGEGKKSLAYSLMYQAADRTLTDKDATQIRQKIIRRLEQELGAKLRS